MKLLVIDFNDRRALNIRRALNAQSHVVHHCSDQVTGLHMATENAYDLLILRDQSPRLQAAHLVKNLKDQFRSPIFVLGDCEDAEGRAQLLRLGADDYLVEPFAMSEFLARVHALCRRQSATDSLADKVKISDLELDLIRRQAFRQGRLLALTAQEFKLLALLARRSGVVLDRAHLREQLWEDAFEGDSNVIDSAIRRLRSKVDRPFEVNLLHTVRGVGYVLEVRDA